MPSSLRGKGQRLWDQTRYRLIAPVQSFIEFSSIIFMEVLLTMGNFHTAILVCLLVGLYDKV